ncbi:MAG: LytTR family transcriptional regulator [Spirosomaceae bacterium]|nr:LytTR family transcriptional regulator [Spirosomataceae bacterium]
MKNEILLGARTVASPTEIVQLRANGNYTTIYFKDGSSLLSSTNLGVLEERLQPYSFFRVNRSVIINLTHLSSFKVHSYKTKVKTISLRKSTSEIFLSRRRLAAFRASVNA